jgi:hypothetical protein
MERMIQERDIWPLVGAVHPNNVREIHNARAPASSEQAAIAVRIKTLFNLALYSVGEFASRALEIARNFVLGLLLWRRDEHIKQTPQQADARSLFCSSGRRDWNNLAMVEEII